MPVRRSAQKARERFLLIPELNHGNRQREVPHLNS
jgi:hypothetical protein